MGDSGVWKRACGLAVAMDFGGGLLSVAVPMMAVRLKADAQYVGIIGSAALVGYTLFCFLAQPLTDKWGRKVSMVLGSTLVTLVCTLMTVSAILQSLPLLGVTNLLVGIFYAFFWPPTQAMSGFGVPQNRFLYSLQVYNLSWSTGRMVGTGLGGVLFEWNPIAPFVLSAFVSGVVAALSALLPFPNIKFSNEVQGSLSHKLPPIVTAAQLGNFIRSFVVIEIVVLLPKLGSQKGWTESQVGGLLFLLFAGQIIAFLSAQFVIRKVTWGWVIGTKVALSLLTPLVGTISNALFLASVLTGIGVVAGLMTVLSLFLSITSQGQSVKGSSRHEAGVGAGGVFGPILGGLALKTASPLVAFSLPIGLTALILAVFDLRALSEEKQWSMVGTGEKT